VFEASPRQCNGFKEGQHWLKPNGIFPTWARQSDSNLPVSDVADYIPSSEHSSPVVLDLCSCPILVSYMSSTYLLFFSLHTRVSPRICMVRSFREWVIRNSFLSTASSRLFIGRVWEPTFKVNSPFVVGSFIIFQSL
jgi:hypothetical protein